MAMYGHTITSRTHAAKQKNSPGIAAPAAMVDVVRRVVGERGGAVGGATAM